LAPSICPNLCDRDDGWWCDSRSTIEEKLRIKIKSMYSDEKALGEFYFNFLCYSWLLLGYFRYFLIFIICKVNTRGSKSGVSLPSGTSRSPGGRERLLHLPYTISTYSNFVPLFRNKPKTIFSE